MADVEDFKLDFEIEWDHAGELMLRTACCCCFCACDDCEQCIKVQTEMICLWLEMREACECCMCSDETDPPHACCEGAQISKTCSMRNKEGDLVCSNLKGSGYYCCCAKGTVNSGCCDPCGSPESCIKAQAQVFCIHQRCALPCDDDVPFEISLCGVTLAGGPAPVE